jgi:serine/threonine-protein kinase
LSVIGEGGMGTVYEVRHRALGKRFALKALRKDLALDAEIAARFIQEARTAAAVSHPGLVEITDFGRLESGQVYFVMELLEGTSLAALLRNGGPLPAARGLAIVRQLVHALKAAHDASIVHRDLKPDNIHIGRGDNDTDRVKIVDFGLAKVVGSSKLTRAGMVFGTPHYMSPEQAAGETVDHRADIYALGIVMYEMFTGKVPFEADSYMGVLTKHMYMTPAPPSDLSP